MKNMADSGFLICFTFLTLVLTPVAAGAQSISPPVLSNQSNFGLKQGHSKQNALADASIQRTDDKADSSPKGLLETTAKGRIPTILKRNIGGGRGISPQEAKSTQILFYSNDRIYHKPLLFEEPMAERFGIIRLPRMHPLKSAAAFLGRSYLYPATLVVGRGRGMKLSEPNTLEPCEKSCDQ